MLQMQLIIILAYAVILCYPLDLEGRQINLVIYNKDLANNKKNRLLGMMKNSNIILSEVNSGTNSKSKVEQIVTFLIEGISSGIYVPGQRLVESDLTTELGISRGPLREAMRLLAAKELLELIPNRGARIKNLQHEDIKQRFYLLEALGGLSISKSTTPEIINYVANAANDFGLATTPTILSRIVDFYCQIAHLSHNNLLADYMYKLNISYFSRHIIIRFNLDTNTLEQLFEQMQRAVIAGDFPKAKKEHIKLCQQIFTDTEKVA